VKGRGPRRPGGGASSAINQDRRDASFARAVQQAPLMVPDYCRKSDPTAAPCQCRFCGSTTPKGVK